MAKEPLQQRSAPRDIKLGKATKKCSNYDCRKKSGTKALLLNPFLSGPDVPETFFHHPVCVFFFTFSFLPSFIACRRSGSRIPEAGLELAGRPNQSVSQLVIPWSRLQGFFCPYRAVVHSLHKQAGK